MSFIKKIILSIFSRQPKATPDFTRLFDIMPLGVVYHDSEGRITFANPAAERILGLSLDQLQGRISRNPDWKAVREDGSDFPGDEHPAMISFMTGKKVSNVIMGLFNPKECSQKWIRINSYPEFIEGHEKPFRVFATFDDITGMKKAESELTDHVARLRRAEQVAGFGNWGFRLDDDTVYASEGARDIYGLGDREWKISEIQKLSLPEHRPVLDKAMMELISAGKPYDVKFRIKRPGDGAIIDVHSIAGFDSEKLGVFGVIHDITSAVKADAALRESERRLSTLMSNLPGIAYRCRNDNNWTMEFISNGCRELTGFEPEDFIENRKISFKDIIHPDYREKIWEKWQKALAGKEYIHDEYPVILPSGEEKWFWEKGCGIYSETGDVIALEGFIADLTDLKKSEKERLDFERQLLQTQKLESLGVLAGGIAHDFNNILMAILGHSELALDELSPLSPARNSIIEIEKASRRAAELCRQMLAYSGKGRFVIENINMRDLVIEMLHLLKTSISKKAELRLDIDRKIPGIKGDATQIRQIVMNLVINASDAIGDKSGIICVSTGSEVFSSDRSDDFYFAGESLSGLYVWLEISDTGCGMDQATMERIFEPFFTTKFTGRGLGMSAVLGIVRGHKGGLRVISEPGAGSTFRIYLPALDSACENIFQKQVEETRPWKGEGTVLLVDDEEAVRKLGIAMLERIGMETVTASDGMEAVDIYRTLHGSISLVILDLTMPRMNGEETFMALMAINPDVNIVISSGYAECETSMKFRGKAVAGFIQKPYKLASLRDCIEKAMKHPDNEVRNVKP